MKNRRMLLAALAVGALALAACGGGGSDTPTNGSGSTSGNGAEGTDGTGGSAGEAVTLTFQSLSDQPAAIAATEAAVAEWNEANPDVQVEIVPTGWDGVYDKLITQFNSGTAPDIIHYEAASVVSFARDGYLADLTDLMSDEFKADLPDGLIDTVSVDGQVIAYPTEMQTYTVFVNNTLAAGAGIELPDGETVSWDDLREMAQTATSGDVYGLAWGLRSPTATFMTMAPQFGGTFFEGSGRDATITIGEGELGLPELVHTMAFEDESIMPVTLTQSGGEALAAWYAGQTVFTIQGSFQAANIANDAPDGFEWSVLPPLEGPAGAKVAANPQTLSVNIDSANVDEAARFIEFFTGTENLAALNQADALIPATISAQEALAASMAGETGWDQILMSGQHMSSAPYLSVDAYAQWKDTVATPAFQQYLADQIDTAGLQQQLTDGWDTITQ